MLLIDAANVVGSRPTGWWRDRAGAARTFVQRVRDAVAAERLSEPVVIVLEGQARRGASEGEWGFLVISAGSCPAQRRGVLMGDPGAGFEEVGHVRVGARG